MKKGITLISLMITIIVLIILLGTTVVSGINSIERAGKIKFATEISYVQELTNNYMLKNGKYPILQQKVVYVSSDDLWQFEKEDVSNGNVLLYELDMSIIGLSDLKYGNGVEQKDKFLVSSKTGKVYYELGYKVNKNTYYTLNDELSSLIGYRFSSKKNNIKFINNSTGYVNDAPDITLSIPDNYEVISVVVKQNNIEDIYISEYLENDNYKIYNINNIANNYNIEIVYKEDANGTQIKDKYSVTNFDSEAPIFKISDIKYLQNNDVKKKYFNVESKSDNLSGIKMFKYVTNMAVDNEDMKEYFSKNGMPVKDDIIIIDNEIKSVTLYMEDNAGNFSYLVVNI